MSDPQAQLAAYLAARKSQPPPASQILPRPAAAPLVLSFTQERFWFLNQLEPGNPAYNRPLGLRLRGPLDAAALDAAIHALVQRHAIFRTIFPAGGTPAVHVIPQLIVPLERLDAPSLPAAERLAADLTHRPFSLEHGPLVRASLIKLAEQDHLLLLVMHHVLCDGWSAPLIVNELAAHYRGDAPPAPALQYADFASWQRGLAEQGKWAADLAYWQGKLAGDLRPLELPADHPRPSVPAHLGGDLYFELPPPTLDALRTLARQENATLFHVLLAIFNILLYRNTGQPDLLVGCPVAGRGLPELENLIGFVINTLVYRTCVDGCAPFRALLGQVRRTALEALDHQSLPFEELLAQLKLDRTLRHAPLFQVMFNFENVPAREPDFGGLACAPFPFDSGQAIYDLSFEIVEREGGLSCWMKYSRDLFDPPTGGRFAKEFITLAESICSQTDIPIALLPFIPPLERKALLEEWHRAPENPPPDLITDAFAAQAAATPDRPALMMGARQLTYRELDARANQLAHFLLARPPARNPRGRIGPPRPGSLYRHARHLQGWGRLPPAQPGAPARPPGLDDAQCRGWVAPHASLLCR